MCMSMSVHVQLPQDRLQPIDSSDLTVCQYPCGMDVYRETYGYLGHLIIIDTRCLVVEFSKGISQELIFWSVMSWALYFHAACHCV